MISYAVIDTEPTSYPVSVAEIKSHAIIEHAADDTLIESYLKAAITELDPPNGYLGRAMMEQTVIAYLRDFPGDRIYLPFPPLISVTSVKYKDGDGDTQTVSASDYEVVTGNEPGYIALVDGATWPTNLDEVEHPIWIEYQAGYESIVVDETTTITVPEGIRLYIKMIVAEMYRHRELTLISSTSRVPHKTWEGFINKYRFSFGYWGDND